MTNDSYTKLYISGDSDFSDDSAGYTDVHTPSLVHFVPTPSGDATINTTTKKFGAGSGSFVSASSQNISFTDHDNWTFGSGNFTIGCWVNFTALPTNGNFMMFASQCQDGNNRWLFAIYNSAGTYQIWFYAVDSSVVRIYQTANLGSSPSTGTWYYVEVGRSTTTLYLSWGGTVLTINGGGTAPGSNSLANLSATLELCWQNLSGSNYFLNGYMDDFFIDKGSCRHTANYSVPTSAGEGNNANTVIYLPLDSDFYDPRLVPQIDTSIKKIGDGSINFSSTYNNSVSLADSADWKLATSNTSGKFSINFWIYFRGSVASSYICGQLQTYIRYWLVYYNGTELHFDSSNFDGSIDRHYHKKVTWSPSADTWYHVSMQFDNGTFAVKINAIDQTVTNVLVDGGDWENLTFPFYIGTVFSTSYPVGNINIDEFIIDIGICRDQGTIYETLDADDSVSFSDSVVKSTKSSKSDSVSFSDSVSKSLDTLISELVDFSDGSSLGSVRSFSDFVDFYDSVGKKIELVVNEYLNFADIANTGIATTFVDFVYFYESVYKGVKSRWYDSFNVKDAVTLFKPFALYILEALETFEITDTVIKSLKKTVNETVTFDLGGGFLWKRGNTAGLTVLDDVLFTDNVTKFLRTTKNDLVDFIIAVGTGNTIVFQDTVEFHDSVTKKISKNIIETVNFSDTFNEVRSLLIYIDNAKIYPEHYITAFQFYGGAEMFCYPEQTCIVEFETRTFANDSLYDPDSFDIGVYDPRNTKRITYDSTKLVKDSTGHYRYAFTVPTSVVYGDWYARVKAIKGNSSTIMNIHFEVKMR